MNECKQGEHYFVSLRPRTDEAICSRCGAVTGWGKPRNHFEEKWSIYQYVVNGRFVTELEYEAYTSKLGRLLHE